MKKVLKSLLIATSGIGAIGGSAAAVASCSVQVSFDDEAIALEASWDLTIANLDIKAGNIPNEDTLVTNIAKVVNVGIQKLHLNLIDTVQKGDITLDSPKTGHYVQPLPNVKLPISLEITLYEKGNRSNTHKTGTLKLTLIGETPAEANVDRYNNYMLFKLFDSDNITPIKDGTLENFKAYIIKVTQEYITSGIPGYDPVPLAALEVKEVDPAAITIVSPASWVVPADANNPVEVVFKVALYPKGSLSPITSFDFTANVTKS